MKVKELFLKAVSVCLVFAFTFVFVACGNEVSYYETDEFASLSTYQKFYYYVTTEGVSEKELVGQNKKLSDAVTSSLDDYTVAWEYGNGSYSVRFAKLLEAVVLKVVLDTDEQRASFEIFVKEGVNECEFSSVILYKEGNIQCASTGVVPEDFSSKNTLVLHSLSGVESMYEKYKIDSHNACAILLLNLGEKIPF